MSSSSFTVAVVILLVVCVLSVNGLASDPVPVNAEPDIPKPRPALVDKVDFGWSYTGEVLGNVRGGLDRGAGYLDLLDLNLAVEGNAFLPWNGGEFFVRVLGTHGGSISEKVGDLQGLSNIEAPRGWRLFEAWYQQAFAAEKVSFLVGRYDVNSEFDSIDSAQLFLNSSHGVGPEFGLSGLNGPSIFPFTTTAFRASFRPFEGITLKGAAADGFSDLLDWETQTDDILLVSEVEVHSARLPFDFAIGFWSYSPWRGMFRGQGGYAYIETPEIALGDTRREMAVFARVGEARGNVSPVEAYFGLGIVLRNLFPGKRDELGFALARADQQGFQRDIERRGSPEKVIEVTYRFSLTPWLTLQPDLQLVLNPGTGPATPSAFVIGSRFELSF